MQNTPYLDAKTQDLLDSFRTDHDIELIGTEEDKPDFIETQDFWNGFQVGGSTYDIFRLSFTVEGFIWHHPSGAVIRGLLAKPVKLVEYVLDAQREEIDSDDYADKVRAAIIAKCGRISGFADSLLD